MAVINIGAATETEKYEKLIASGVIDPTRVVRFALEKCRLGGGFDDNHRSRYHRKAPETTKVSVHAGYG